MLTPSPAHAAYEGLRIREQPSLSADASAQTGRPTTVLRLYAQFDGPGTAGTLGDPGLANNVVVVESDLRLRGADRDLFQSPFGSDSSPNLGLLGVDPTLQYDSYVSIGVSSLSGGQDDDNTEFAPDWQDAGFGRRSVQGTYFASAPPITGNALGAANAEGEVFLAQLTIENLDLSGADQPLSLYAPGTLSPPTPDIPQGSFYTASFLETDLLSGRLRVFTHKQFTGFDVHDIFFVPSPGATAPILAAALLAATRRRRDA
jgi:hypothetical protein